jgi:SAM-dependent methyltransferase
MNNKNFYKKKDIANKYCVSEDTVTNWIKATQENKLPLQLIYYEKKPYILQTPFNNNFLSELSVKSKKFRNKKSFKRVKPQKEFYKIYDETKVIEIIANIKDKEMNTKFDYFGERVCHWDEFLYRFITSKETTPMSNTLKLLDNQLEYILSLIEDFDCINIIDIGVGNGWTMKKILEFFKNRKVIRKYIGLDYSPDMIKLASNNLDLWFGDEIHREFYQSDFANDKFKQLLYLNTKSKTDSGNCCNLIFFLGSEIEGQIYYTKPLEVIKESMSHEDIFILGHWLEIESIHNHLGYFSQYFSEYKNDIDMESHYTVFDLMNIKREFYNVERFFDYDERKRIIRATFNYDVLVEIETQNIKEDVLINNKDKIVLFRHSYRTYEEVVNTFSIVGFQIISAVTTPNRDQIMVIAKLN